MDKALLRQQLLQQRRSLSVDQWRLCSDRLCAQLQQSPHFTQACTILAYRSFRQEPDLASLFTLNKVWGLPRCVGTALIWHQWRPEDGWVSGAYGIQEPAATLPILEAQAVDLILVPAVACDLAGYRLGYGGGFYDRLLARPEWRTIPTIGIVFEMSVVEKLPIEPWDQTLTAFCTEAGYRDLGVISQQSHDHKAL